MSPGERRRRQRKRERDRTAYAAKIAELQSMGASCCNCEHLGHEQSLGPICDLDSDFHGYQKTRQDHLCTRWKAQGGGQ